MAREIGHLLNKVTLDPDKRVVMMSLIDESWIQNSGKAVGLCLIGKMVLRKPANLEYM